MGAVTPIGSGVEEYWNNLIAGACGIDKIRQFDATDLAVRIAAEVHSFDLQKYMPKKMIHETDAFTQYAYVAAAEALAMAGKKDGERSGENARMSDDPDRSAGIGLPADPDQMGIVMGTAMAGVATTAATQEILTNAVHKNVGPRFVPRILGNIAAAQIAIAHGSPVTVLPCPRPALQAAMPFPQRQCCFRQMKRMPFWQLGQRASCARW